MQKWTLVKFNNLYIYSLQTGCMYHSRYAKIYDSDENIKIFMNNLVPLKMKLFYISNFILNNVVTKLYDMILYIENFQYHIIHYSLP